MFELMLEPPVVKRNLWGADVSLINGFDCIFIGNNYLDKIVESLRKYKWQWRGGGEIPLGILTGTLRKFENKC